VNCTGWVAATGLKDVAAAALALAVTRAIAEAAPVSQLNLIENPFVSVSRRECGNFDEIVKL
jgi:hypothetical protein